MQRAIRRTWPNPDAQTRARRGERGGWRRGLAGGLRLPVLLALALAARGQAPPANLPPMPRILCRPCGEVPPPPGYTCAGNVMVYASVATAEIPQLTATACAVAAKEKPPTQAVESGGAKSPYGQPARPARAAPARVARHGSRDRRRRRKRRPAVGRGR